MTKEQWREHMRDVGPHSPDLCEQCRERRKTRRANLNRKCRSVNGTLRGYVLPGRLPSP